MSINLTTFIPGTKAKADEINANFSTLKDAILERATKEGNSSQQFSIAKGTEDSHAINKAQLTESSNQLISEINRIGTKFCAKSGNTTNGEADLFSYDVYQINPKIAGTYENLIIVDYSGNQTTISKTPASISLTGNANGTYNIFITPEGNLYILNNTIYKQKKRPTMLVNDIWLDISKEPLKCIKYSGTSDAEFKDVPLGKVTFKDGAITSIETFAFNQNGYNINTLSSIKSGTPLAASIQTFAMPNYIGAVEKSFGVTYQAEKNGYLYIWGSFGTSLSISPDGTNWYTVQNSWFSDQGYSCSSFIPVPKGAYYSAGGSHSRSLVFFPCFE